MPRRLELRRRVAIAALAVLIVGPVLVMAAVEGAAWADKKNLASSIEPGMTAGQVEGLLGAPDARWWVFGEWEYESPFRDGFPYYRRLAPLVDWMLPLADFRLGPSTNSIRVGFEHGLVTRIDVP